MKIKSIKQLGNKISGKKVLVRVDFNVPVHNGKVADDFKIVNTLPLLRYLLRYNCKIIILSHLGRPKNGRDKNLSLAPVAKRLSALLDKKIKFLDDSIGLEVGTAAAKLQPKEILMLENLRFYKEEDKNNLKFAKELSILGDVYINEAFAFSHRKTASMSAIKKYIPAYAGLLLEKEIENLNKILKPEKPLVIIMGGSKIETKLPLIKNLYPKAHRILIGGILANNFLAAMDYEVGKSIIDKKDIKLAKKLMGEKIILPIDAVVAKENRHGVEAVSVNKIPKNSLIFDIGPESIKLFSRYINNAKTVVWNGPMGMYEDDSFKYGTLSTARLVAAKSKGKAFGLVGGGETIDALKKTKMQDDVDWVSTGGGAMLTYLGGEKMPGLEGIV